MKLEDIGFYTLSDKRAETSNINSPMWRCELILLDSCNFKCPYCRGLRNDCQGVMPFEQAEKTLQYWIKDDLQNIRFSGGEPTLYPDLDYLVYMCHRARVRHIALSTNGSADFEIYNKLRVKGVNDFSISLDACCAGKCKTMSGVDMFEKIKDNIKRLSKLTYVTIGIVVTEENSKDFVDTIIFASELGVADIRPIPAAQNSYLSLKWEDIPKSILSKHPILKYRTERQLNKQPIRGMTCNDFIKCNLIKDDSVVAGKWHFPCVIYLREGGKPIGEVNPNMRQERLNWIENTNTYKDPICRNNCLDVCVAYNNKTEFIEKMSLRNEQIRIG